MTEAWLGLGSNQNDPAAQLRQALRWLGAQYSLKLISPVYQSPAMVLPGEDASLVGGYLNMVVCCNTEQTAIQLLVSLKQQEQQQGRDLAAKRWSSRTLDIDILMFGAESITRADLTVPHIGITQRDFVLLPWCDISPNTVIPQLGTVADCAQRLGETTAVKIADSLDDL